MISREWTVLVFGATGQQGGSVANALRADGWRVRALVREPGSNSARHLAHNGIELAQGNLDDTASIRAAMDGIYGVFSVQPSSGQGAAYGVSDEQEIRYGKAVADSAVAMGIQHLVYSSVNAAGPTETGMGHFDSKAKIEDHVRRSGVRYTILRPAAFMELLVLPGMGLDQGSLNFFVRPDQAMQFIAVADIGKIAAAIFAEPDKFASRTLEIAGDRVTGDDLQEKFSRAAGRNICYHRYPDSLLEQNSFIAQLSALVDDGRLAGNADIDFLRREFQGLQTMDAWLSGSGKPLLEEAIKADGATLALR